MFWVFFAQVGAKNLCLLVRPLLYFYLEFCEMSRDTPSLKFDIPLSFHFVHGQFGAFFIVRGSRTVS